jgi:glycine betaine/choline ABC-type transport system substrate-binding protein
MQFGGPPEFKTRPDGIPGLKKNYGVSFGKYTVTDVGGPVTVNALKRGQIDAADLFTTDPSIAANGFVLLEDPKSNFAAQNVVPLITKSKATDGVKKVLNEIQAKLTTQNLGAMYAKVVNDKADPADVAKGFLTDNGLDATGTSAKGVSLTVGSANFPENVILADIYSQALEAQGASVQTKLNIGARPKYWDSLKKGSIDLFPEYTGSIMAYLDKNATATTPDEVYAALGKLLPANLVELDYAQAQDSDAIVVTKQTAEKFGLKTIADLAKKG